MTQRKILVQIYSDLHLELTRSIPKITPKCNYLFLAGDISRFTHPSFKDFLVYCNQNWEKTFYIFGNHDYWNTNSYMESIKKQSYDFLKENELSNIYILDNSFVSLNEDIVVFGSTFWTQSPFITAYEASIYINDYNMIKVKRHNTYHRLRELEPKDINELNFEDTSAIYNLLNNNELVKNKKIIIMTHFPPQQTNTSHSKYASHVKVLKKYFSHPDGTIKEFENTSHILCWISGHTHYSYDFVSPEGVRLISNQVGYIKEVISGISGFKEDGLFEIEY